MRRLAFLILALTILRAAPLRAGDVEPGLGDHDPRERRKAVGRLADRTGPVVVRALVHALADEAGTVRERAASVLVRRTDPDDRRRLFVAARRDRRPIVREELAGVIARWSGDGVLACLRDLLRDRVDRVREAAARGLGDRGSACDAPALEPLLADRSPGPRIAALEALDRLDPAASARRAVGLLADGEPEVRVAALFTLAARGAEGSVDALVGGLADPDWSVRAAAARALARLRLASSVPPLIDALEREEGRVREEVHRALAAVSGVGLPDDPGRWRAWWARVGETFEPPDRPAAAPAVETASAVTYHSIPVTSRRIAFVIDASRSMLQPAAEKAEGEEDGPSRRDRAIAELEATLRRLPRGTRFNLVLFGPEIVRWQPEARPAGPASIRDALKTVERMPAGGWTDLHGALVRALRDRSVDTIYVLTDGAPSAGRYSTPSSLLAAVERLNRYRLVRIHTVGFGTRRVAKRWRGFLADLARAHDGVHVSR